MKFLKLLRKNEEKQMQTIKTCQIDRQDHTTATRVFLFPGISIFAVFFDDQVCE